MPRPRFSRLDPAKRRAILEAAASEFATHGFEQASLNHIIDALGLSKGVFYYYFDSKADLFGAVIELVWEVLFPDRSFAIERLDASTFWPRLEALSRDTRQRVRGLPWLAGIGRLLYHPLPAAELDDLVRARSEQGRAWLAALIGHGQQIGAVRSDLPTDLLLAVLTAADQAADHWMVDHLDLMSVDTQDRLFGEVFGLWRRIAEPGVTPQV
jgi:AcrR family transcriptional regulator